MKRWIVKTGLATHKEVEADWMMFAVSGILYFGVGRGATPRRTTCCFAPGGWMHVEEVPDYDPRRQ